MSRPELTTSLKNHRYRAPNEHGQVLAIPEMDTAVEEARHNSECLSAENVEIDSIPLHELRQQARREIITKAVEWTNKITGQAIACAECSHHASLLFVTGHQPQLAHAGVWAKNFAASGLATRSQGVSLNIVVDNDTVGTQSIRVPTGTRESPSLVDVSFDTTQPQQPWEELSITDRELFESFAARVSKEMVNWGIDPLLNQMWPGAVQASRRTPSTVECLSACRIQQERRWGVNNLELPLSEICQTESFLIFVKHLLLHAEQFHTSYNLIVESYRNENGIRNDRHPVPNLHRIDDAFELPFWFWRKGDSERGQVFVRRANDRVELICRGEVILVATENELLNELQALQENGKLRTRALTTTLFSRLCLADLFIHGIGGAKYDEMADRLIAEFFGIEPPHFLVLSATMHLPIEKFDIREEDVRKLKNKLREFEYNADRYLKTPSASALKIRKDELIQQHWASQTTGLPKRKRVQRRVENRLRHLELKRLNQSLCDLAAEQVQQLQSDVAVAESKLSANSILKSREFPAVLFSEQAVHILVDQLSVTAASVSSC